MHGDLTITAEEATGAWDTSKEQRLFPEHLGPVLSPELAQRVALRQSADLADPALAPVRLHTRTRRNAWAMWGAAAGATVPLPTPSQAGPEFEHYYFTLEAAVRGLGIAVAPWHLVMDDVLAGRLVAPLGFVASGYDYVVRRRTSGPLPRLDVFCAWLHAQALANPVPPGAQGPPSG